MASSTIVKRIGCKEENETLAEGQSRIIGSNNNASFVPPKVDKRRVAPLTPEEQIRRQRLDKIRRVSTQFCLYVILCTVAFLAFEVAGVLILSAANGSSFVATVWPNRVAHLAEEVAPSRVSGTSMSQNRSAVEISSLSEMFPFKQANSSLTSISQDWIAFVVDYYVQAWYYDKAFLSFISLPIFSLTGYLLFSIPLSLLVIFDCSFINKYYIQVCSVTMFFAQNLLFFSEEIQRRRKRVFTLHVHDSSEPFYHVFGQCISVSYNQTFDYELF